MDIQAQLQFVFDEIKGVWRYRWIGIGAAWLVGVVGWLGLSLMPDTYRATAKMFIDTSTSIKPLLQGLAIDTDTQSQIDLVRLAMLSRPQLEKVAESMNLLDANMSDSQREVRLNALAKQVGVTGEAGHGSERTYTITYEDTNRDRSARLVKTLLDSFVNDVVGGNKDNQATAQQFLIKQIHEYEGRLTTAEEALADFKKRNLGLVPGERGDYFSRMQAEENARDDVQGRLNVILSKRGTLAEQLRGETAYVPVTDPGKIARSNEGAPDTAGRLQEAEARLQELLLRFTDKHPDVVATRATIVDLKARQERELAALRAGNIGEAGSTAASANPVYQRIQQTINEIDVEIAAMRRDINDRNQRIAGLRKLADTAPEVEAEYARLNRDYGITKAQYQSLVERLERARLTEQAEETGVIKFEVIEPPHATQVPVSPNRPLIAVAVLILACGAGIGAAYLKHMTKPVFFSTQSLSSALGRPVLGSVTFARPGAWLSERSAAIRHAALAMSALVAVFVLVLITQNSFSRWLQSVLLQQV